MHKKLRIIFLDFDGVLNNEGSFKNGKVEPIDPKAIELLNSLIRETDACIVISSSWRTTNTLDWLQTMMSNAGLEFPERIIGLTTNLSNKTDCGLWIAKTRGKEIALWLEQVYVDSFVIFDDNDDMEPVKDNLVQTTFEKGLLQEHIDKAKKILLND
jgi:trehalose-6-phosphatase